MDSAQKGADKVADSIKSGIDQTEYGIDNPRITARGVSSSAKSGVDDAAENTKSGVDQAQDAINNPRTAAGDAARSTRSNVDDAADSELLPCISCTVKSMSLPPSAPDAGGTYGCLRTMQRSSAGLAILSDCVLCARSMQCCPYSQGCTQVDNALSLSYSVLCRLEECCSVHRGSGDRHPLNVSGTSENVQEGIDSVAEGIDDCCALL